MSKPAIHVSEAEAANDSPSLLAHVRAGADVVIERDAEAVAVIRAAAPHVRLLSESLSGQRAGLERDARRRVRPRPRSGGQQPQRTPHAVRVGLILDSSVAIAAARRGDSVQALLQRVIDTASEQEVAISPVGVVELVRGIHRADILMLMEDEDQSWI